MLADVRAMARWTLLAFGFVTSCGRRPIDPVHLESPNHGAFATHTASSADIAAPALPILPRKHAPEAPPEGWCGETAIQEGLLALGAWAPQRAINKAGKPAHPDLYSGDIPAALTALGARHSAYSGGKGFAAYARWVNDAIDDGDPVIAGVKILPTEHPAWGLDHFVLVVGHGPSELLVNTTWGTRRWVGDTTTPGLSFKNAFYAIRLHGLALPPDARRARLTVLEEDASAVKVHVVCGGLQTGARYRLERRTSPKDGAPEWSEDLTADAGQVAKDLVLDASRAARFRCVAR